jgi:hypothetical protein
MYKELGQRRPNLHTHRNKELEMLITLIDYYMFIHVSKYHTVPHDYLNYYILINILKKEMSTDTQWCRRTLNTLSKVNEARLKRLLVGSFHSHNILEKAEL